jgi:hypothetical protein
MSYVAKLEAAIAAMHPCFEREVDEQILAEPKLEDRLLLMQHRERIIRAHAEAMRRRSLERHVAELERRLRPRLVET